MPPYGMILISFWSCPRPPIQKAGALTNTPRGYSHFMLMENDFFLCTSKNTILLFDTRSWITYKRMLNLCYSINLHTPLKISQFRLRLSGVWRWLQLKCINEWSVEVNPIEIKMSGVWRFLNVFRGLGPLCAFSNYPYFTSYIGDRT